MLMRSLSPRYKSTILSLGLIAATSAILFGIAISIHAYEDVPLHDLTRDPTAIAEIPFYMGFLSQVGLLFWSAAVATCFFSFAVIPKYRNSIKIRSFLLATALLTMLFGLDDAFLLHETVLPYHMGIPEDITYIFYGFLSAAYVVKFYRILFSTEYLLMILALAFLGVSISLDFFNLGVSPFFEDGAKLMGIMSWLAYLFQMGKSMVRKTMLYPSPTAELFNKAMISKNLE